MEKVIQSRQQTTTTEQDEELNRLKFKLSSRFRDEGYKLFYIWHEEKHSRQYVSSNGNCCFWHLIGAPRLNNKDMPALPYQKLLSQVLREHQCILIKKSRGLGVTEYLLRHIAYCCVTGIFPPNSRVCLTTGPRIDIAEDLISRFKGLFSKVAPNLFDKSKSTVAILNGVKVEAFPSHNCASMRGLDNVKFIMSDEADFYPRFQQQEIRAVSEGYLAKPNSSDLTIVFVSTPNAPGGLLQQLELEKDSLYYHLFLDYRYGLEGSSPIYSQEHIDEVKKKSHEFGREFELKYLGQVGNVLSDVAIDRCISLGEKLAETAPLDNWNIATKYVMSIDIGWGLSKGSSNTAIIVSRFISGKVQIIYCKEFSQPDFRNILDTIWQLYHKCHGREYLQNILMDASATELYTALCSEFDQNSSQSYLADKQRWCKEGKDRYIGDYLFVCPISFNPQGRYMLNHAQRIIEFQEDDGTAVVGIDRDHFGDLITACRTAYAEGDKLLKDRGVFADSFDSLLMNLSFYKWSKK
jgi:hypothetical protein